MQEPNYSDINVRIPARIMLTKLTALCPVLLGPTDAAKRKVDQDECEWTFTLQPHTERVDTVMVPPPAETPSSGQPPVAGPLFPACSTQADSSTLPPSATQVTMRTHTAAQVKVAVFLTF